MVVRGVTQANHSDRKEETSTKKGQLLARLDTLMGGRVAEEILLGKDQITTGNCMFKKIFFVIFILIYE